MQTFDRQINLSNTLNDLFFFFFFKKEKALKSIVMNSLFHPVVLVSLVLTDKCHLFLRVCVASNSFL